MTLVFLILAPHFDDKELDQSGRAVRSVNSVEHFSKGLLELHPLIMIKKLA